MKCLVIGAGFGAQHASWISQTGARHQVALAYQTNDDRAALLQIQLGLIEIGSDPEAMIRNGGYDLIAVVTPPETHLDFVRVASSSDAAIILDKPIAQTIEDSVEIGRLAETHPKPMYIFFQWRLHPMVSKIRSLADQARFGEITHIELEFTHDFLAAIETASPWRHESRRAGGGALADLGVHLFDLLRYLSREDWHVRSAVSGIAHPVRFARAEKVFCDTDDFAETHLIANETARTARISVSRVSLSVRQISVRLFGTKAILAASLDPGTGAGRIILRDADGTTQDEQIQPDDFNPYVSILEPPVRGGNGGMSSLASIYDGIAAQELMLKAQQFSNSKH